MEFANFLLSHEFKGGFASVSTVVFLQRKTLNIFNKCFIDALTDLGTFTKTQKHGSFVNTSIGVGLYKGIGTLNEDLLTMWIDEDTDFTRIEYFLSEFKNLTTVIYMLNDANCREKASMACKLPTPTNYAKHVFYHSDRLDKTSRSFSGFNEGVDALEQVTAHIANADVLKLVKAINSITNGKPQGFVVGFMTAVSKHIAIKLNKKRFETTMPLIDYINWPGYMSLDSSAEKYNGNAYEFSGDTILTHLLNQTVTTKMLSKFIADDKAAKTKADTETVTSESSTSESSTSEQKKGDCDDCDYYYDSDCDFDSGDDESDDVVDDVDDDIDVDDNYEKKILPTEPYKYTTTESALMKLISSACSVAANLESMTVVRADRTVMTDRPTLTNKVLEHVPGQTTYMKMTTGDFWKFVSNFEMLGYTLD